MYTEKELIELVKRYRSEALNKALSEPGEKIDFTQPRIPFNELPKKWQEYLSNDAHIAEIALSMNEFGLFDPPIVPSNWRYTIFLQTKNGHEYTELLRKDILSHLPQQIYENIKTVLQKCTYTATLIDKSLDGTKSIKPKLDIQLYPTDFAKEFEKLSKQDALQKSPKSDIITVKTPSKIDFPLDKINRNVWNLFKESTMRDGQMKFNISQTGSSTAIPALYSINFDGMKEIEGLKLSKELDPYDKRLYIAFGALASVTDCFSVSQLYKVMGNTSSPSPAAIAKISDRLTRMNVARIYIDNSAEAEAYKDKPRYVYDGHLLPFERISKVINGKLVEAAIHPLREPPLLEFARKRKQITKIPKKLLESPISKTNAHLQIEDYLIDYISHVKNNPTLSKKLTFDTLFKNCGIDSAMQKKRAKDAVAVYLEHFKNCDFINDYSIGKDAIIITIK